jgi:hypothetical protein
MAEMILRLCMGLVRSQKSEVRSQKEARANLTRCKLASPPGGALIVTVIILEEGKLLLLIVDRARPTTS